MDGGVSSEVRRQMVLLAGGVGVRVKGMGSPQSLEPYRTADVGVMNPWHRSNVPGSWRCAREAQPRDGKVVEKLSCLGYVAFAFSTSSEGGRGWKRKEYDHPLPIAAPEKGCCDFHPWVSH